ncbi:MAG TPA: hypothetical protein ENK84_05930, partial [Desulfobulbus sp.]|nr:hypothetical protein [Desulfobulbus sp.]
QQHLKLKGLQPKTIEAYSRAIRRIGNYFGGRVDDLNSDQLLEYFTDLLECHSWSTVKLDLCKRHDNPIFFLRRLCVTMEPPYKPYSRRSPPCWRRRKRQNFPEASGRRMFGHRKKVA